MSRVDCRGVRLFRSILSICVIENGAYFERHLAARPRRVEHEEGGIVEHSLAAADLHEHWLLPQQSVRNDAEPEGKNRSGCGGTHRQAMEIGEHRGGVRVHRVGVAEVLLAPVVQIPLIAVSASQRPSPQGRGDAMRERGVTVGADGGGSGHGAWAAHQFDTPESALVTKVFDDWVRSVHGLSGTPPHGSLAGSCNHTQCIRKRPR